MNNETFEKLLEKSILSFGDTYIDIPPEMYSPHDFPEGFEKKIYSLEKNNKGKILPFKNKRTRNIAAAAVIALITIPAVIILAFNNNIPQDFSSTSNSQGIISSESREDSMEDNIPSNDFKNNGFSSTEKNTDKILNEESIEYNTDGNFEYDYDDTESVNEIVSKYPNGSANCNYGDMSSPITLSNEDISALSKIVSGKIAVQDNPSCSFDISIMFVVNDTMYCPALDRCGVIYIPSEKKYIYLSEEENQSMRQILESYGFKYTYI